MAFNEIVKSAVSRLGIIRVSNALNPILYITLFVFPICCFAAWIFGDDPILKYGFVGLGAAFPLAFLWHYTRFAYSEPNRLQSEEHLARMRELSIVERKSSQGREMIPPTQADAPITEQELLSRNSGEVEP